MTIVAFLQNQWFKDPARMRQMLDTTFKGDRPKFVRTWLFWNCLTGRRLEKALGEDLCDDIVWENASPQIAGQSDGQFPADVEHMRRVIEQHKPDVVIGFGRIACPPLQIMKQQGDGWELIMAPHPAARHGTVCAELEAMAEKVRTAISRGQAA